MPDPIARPSHRPARALVAAAAAAERGLPLALRASAVLLAMLFAAARPAAALDPPRTPQRIAEAIEPETLGIALPFEIRAAIGARYLLHDRLADALTARYLDAPGPRVAPLRALETRVTLSHALAPRLDFQVEWRTRNRIASDDLLGMGEQFVGALFRFTP